VDGLMAKLYFFCSSMTVDNRQALENLKIVRHLTAD
jgi:hypothetical protein